MAGEKDTDEEPEVVPSDRGRSDAEARVRSVHEIWERPREVQPEPVRTEPVVSVNVLCLLGAIVGVVSLFLPWVITGEGLSEIGVSLARMTMEIHGVPSDPMLISALVFITGTVIAFMFPVAFAVQAAGIVLFLTAFLDNSASPPLEYYYELSLGFYLGVLSLAMVIAGLLHPSGPGYDPRWPWWSRRTEVASRADTLEGRLARQGLAMPGEMVRALRGNGSRPYAAVVVITLMTGVFLIGLQIHLTADPVTVTDEVVKVVVGHAATFAIWDYARLTLTDGSATVNWTAESVRWADAHKTKEHELPMAYFGAQNLSGLVLGLTVVDVSGDGRVTQGDMMFLSPCDGSSFAEDGSYRMTIAYTYTPTRLLEVSMLSHAMYAVGVITFEFEGGEVASSSADILESYLGDHGPEWTLLSVAVVAIGSTILGAAYYVPVRSIRRRVLGGRSQGAGACDGSEGR